VKFTAEGGIGLTVEGDIQNNAARFTVWDTGIGIAPENFPRLFQPFVQIDSRLAREYGGTGLGLALVQRMVERHGGSVEVESEEGKGSRFSVILPWKATDDQTVDTTLLSPFSTHKALTVEDAPIVAEQLSRYLQDLGISNVIHGSGKGVIDRVIETQPDVILLDILLPDSSGWDVLKELREDARTCTIPVVIISILDERSKGMALGAAGYLVKPVSRADLQMALRGGESYRMTKGISSMDAIRKDALRGADQNTNAFPLILLADDNEVALAAIGDYLKSKNYRVTVAHNGVEAVERALETRPDLILMDIQMPGMDGLEAIRRIRAESAIAKTPIIALTALVMPGDREQCLTAGADDYLSKPVRLKYLVEVMQRFL